MITLLMQLTVKKQAPFIEDAFQSHDNFSSMGAGAKQTLTNKG